jgi:hypothetical protein
MASRAPCRALPCYYALPYFYSYGYGLDCVLTELGNGWIDCAID